MELRVGSKIRNNLKKKKKKKKKKRKGKKRKEKKRKTPGRSGIIWPAEPDTSSTLTGNLGY